MDWGLIAKQWIKMKEDGIQIPPAPIISGHHSESEEQGAAEMDIIEDNESSDSNHAVWNTLQQYQNLQQQDLQKSQSVASPWANNWVPGNFPTIVNSAAPSVQTTNPWVNPNPFPNTSNPPVIKQQPPSLMENINIYRISAGTQKTPASTNPEMWTNKSQFLNKTPVPLLSNESSNNIQEDMTLENSDTEDTTQTIDKNSRKLLPAWIREGKKIV